MSKVSLKKFIYLSICAAVVTILLKFYAYYITNSMGLFSDALESFVNLFAAIVALIMLNLAEQPADKKHAYGHSKAEYFSSAIEGGLIVIAAMSIIWSAVPRLLNPKEIENVSSGLIISLAASLVNLFVAIVLIRNGKKQHSLLLEADGKHLLTDVWTSAGVIVAVILVKITGILILDPIIAILVAINIVWTGFQLLKRSASGLLDSSISEPDFQKIKDYLELQKSDKIDFHSIMTRQAGQRKFISLHVLVPGDWSVKQGHDLCEKIEIEIESLFNTPITTNTHLEPIEDPSCMYDIGIDRVTL